MPLVLAVIACLALALSARADESVDYVRQIKPILQSRCYACHGVLKQEAGLRLDTAALAVRGSENGPIVQPGTADESPLLKRISSNEESMRMPPEGEPLTAAQIALIRAWIAQGANGPADEQPERDPRDHWAFKTPVRPAAPAVASADWVQNPIDAFVAAERERRSLTPQPPADKRTWLRRVSLDLTGLPPTAHEQAAFLADDAPDAHARVVTRLLASPHYGERWGRHWMDIWRYSDWWGLGAEVRNSQKHIWHWRDWIVESLNADVGYDQMLREMLAADELYPNDLNRMRASGYLARQYFKFNRSTWLDETIEHTSKAFLGLTFNCAKCHDHKYDPIRQAEYYQLRAFFEPYQVRTDVVPGEADFELDGIPRAFDCNLEAPTFVHIRGDDRNPDKSRPIEPVLPALLAFGEFRIEPVQLPVDAHQPGLRPFVVDAYLNQAEKRIAAARVALETARQQLAAAEAASAGGNKPADGAMPVEHARLAVVVAEKGLVTADSQPPAIRARALADRAALGMQGASPPTGSTAEETVHAAVRAERVVACAKADEDVSQAELNVLRAAADKKEETEKKLAEARGVYETALKAIDAPGGAPTPLIGALKAFESNLETEESRRKPYPATSTGRRSMLAGWLTDPRHPLAARVAVNHIWSRHFGRALVPTVFDFGRKGTPPTHPELLDWLAVELVESGWNMRHIHRLITTSSTYRLASSSAGAATENLAIDPENRYYWRSNPVRMEAQIVRDALLHLAGDLDLQVGGPSIPVGDEASRRRSMYFVHSHNEHQPFLSIFDDASVLECYRRVESIVPQQALALENSPLAATMAQRISQRIATDTPGATDSDFIRQAFLSVLSAEPSAAEQAAASEALGALTEAAKRQNHPEPVTHARVNLIHALLNHNDFITVR